MYVHADGCGGGHVVVVALLAMCGGGASGCVDRDGGSWVLWLWLYVVVVMVVNGGCSGYVGDYYGRLYVWWW